MNASPLIQRVALYVTLSCNLRCKHCYVEGSPANERLEQPHRQQLIETIGLLGKPVDLTGGEPLLDPDLPSLARVSAYTGMRCWLTGLIACTPRNTPVFGRSVASRSTSDTALRRAWYAPSSSWVFGGAQLPCQWRVGCDDHESRSEQGVRPCGEHPNSLGLPLNLEVDVGAFGASDPVALHRQDVRRPPGFQLLHVVEQPLGTPRRDLSWPPIMATPTVPNAVPDSTVAQHGTDRPAQRQRTPAFPPGRLPGRLRLSRRRHWR